MPPPVSKTVEGDLGKKAERGKDSHGLLPSEGHSTNSHQLGHATEITINFPNRMSQNGVVHIPVWQKGSVQFDNANHLNYFVELFSL